MTSPQKIYTLPGYIFDIIHDYPNRMLSTAKNRNVGIKVSILLLTVIVFLVRLQSVNAQTSGQSPQPPTFPKCQNKLASGPGDKKHEEGDPSNDIYSLLDGNFLECSCTGGEGEQTNWWNIYGIPLGQTGIDAYNRAGWDYTEDGLTKDLLNVPYLSKTSQFSCNTSVVSTATKTPTPSKRVTETPTPTTSTAGDSDQKEENLPTTGPSETLFAGIAVLSGIGFYLRSQFKIL